MRLSLKSSIFPCALALLTLCACHSVPETTRVIEKSRQVQPDWVARATSFQSTAEGVDYVMVKDRVLDLTLGLTQTESSVLVNLRYHLYQAMLGHLDMSHLSAASAKRLHEQLGKILDKEVTKANVRDLYYDRITIPDAEKSLIPEYYRVFADAGLTAQQREALLRDVNGFLKTAGSSDLSALSGSLKEI